MTSQKLAQSNRVNALKSTGPRSAAGKAAVAANAIKSGIYAKAEIILGEDPVALEALTAEYVDHYAPADPQERYQLDIMIRAEWQSRRLARVEAQLFAYRTQNFDAGTEQFPLGRIYFYADNTFSRLQRQVTATHRIYMAASRELASLQAARAAAEAAAAEPDRASSDPQTADFPALSPEIGFVSSTPLKPQSPAPTLCPDPLKPPTPAAVETVIDPLQEWRGAN